MKADNQGRLRLRIAGGVDTSFSTCRDALSLKMFPYYDSSSGGVHVSEPVDYIDQAMMTMYDTQNTRVTGTDVGRELRRGLGTQMVSNGVMFYSDEVDTRRALTESEGDNTTITMFSDQDLGCDAVAMAAKNHGLAIHDNSRQIIFVPASMPEGKRDTLKLKLEQLHSGFAIEETTADMLGLQLYFDEADDRLLNLNVPQTLKTGLKVPLEYTVEFEIKTTAASNTGFINVFHFGAAMHSSPTALGVHIQDGALLVTLGADASWYTQLTLPEGEWISITIQQEQLDTDQLRTTLTSQDGNGGKQTFVKTYAKFPSEQNADIWVGEVLEFEPRTNILIRDLRVSSVADAENLIPQPSRKGVKLGVYRVEDNCPVVQLKHYDFIERPAPTMQFPRDDELLTSTGPLVRSEKWVTTGVLVSTNNPDPDGNSNAAGGDGYNGNEVEFTLTDLQRAVITFTGDYWSGVDSSISSPECGVLIDGNANSCAASITIDSAGQHTVQVTDTYGDGKNAATVTIQEGGDTFIQHPSDGEMAPHITDAYLNSLRLSVSNVEKVNSGIIAYAGQVGTHEETESSRTERRFGWKQNDASDSSDGIPFNATPIWISHDNSKHGFDPVLGAGQSRLQGDTARLRNGDYYDVRAIGIRAGTEVQYKAINPWRLQSRTSDLLRQYFNPTARFPSGVGMDGNAGKYIWARDDRPDSLQVNAFEGCLDAHTNDDDALVVQHKGAVIRLNGTATSNNALSSVILYDSSAEHADRQVMDIGQGESSLEFAGTASVGVILADSNDFLIPSKNRYASIRAARKNYDGSVRDEGTPYGPEFYKASSNITIGASVAADEYHGAGHIWNTSGTAFQINLERTGLEIERLNNGIPYTSYTDTDGAHLSDVEFWNGDRRFTEPNVAGTDQLMADGNWVDPEYYAFEFAQGMSIMGMSIRTAGGVTTLEEGIQWTLTGWGQTVLRGTVVMEDNGGTIFLKVKQNEKGLPEYRNFPDDMGVNSQEDFGDSALAATEVMGYKFLVAERNALSTYDGAASKEFTTDDLTEGMTGHVELLTSLEGDDGLRVGDTEYVDEVSAANTRVRQFLAALESLGQDVYPKLLTASNGLMHHAACAEAMDPGEIFDDQNVVEALDQAFSLGLKPEQRLFYSPTVFYSMPSVFANPAHTFNNYANFYSAMDELLPMLDPDQSDANLKQIPMQGGLIAVGIDKLFERAWVEGLKSDFVHGFGKIDEEIAGVGANAQFELVFIDYIKYVLQLGLTGLLKADQYFMASLQTHLPPSSRDVEIDWPVQGDLVPLLNEGTLKSSFEWSSEQGVRLIAKMLETLDAARHSADICTWTQAHISAKAMGLIVGSNGTLESSPITGDLRDIVPGEGQYTVQNMRENLQQAVTGAVAVANKRARHEFDGTDATVTVYDGQMVTPAVMSGNQRDRDQFNRYRTGIANSDSVSIIDRNELLRMLPNLSGNANSAISTTQLRELMNGLGVVAIAYGPADRSGRQVREFAPVSQELRARTDEADDRGCAILNRTGFILTHPVQGRFEGRVPVLEGDVPLVCSIHVPTTDQTMSVGSGSLPSRQDLQAPDPSRLGLSIGNAINNYNDKVGGDDKINVLGDGLNDPFTVLNASSILRIANGGPQSEATMVTEFDRHSNRANLYVLQLEDPSQQLFLSDPPTLVIVVEAWAGGGKQADSYHRDVRTINDRWSGDAGKQRLNATIGESRPVGTMPIALGTDSMAADVAGWQTTHTAGNWIPVMRSEPTAAAFAASDTHPDVRVDEKTFKENTGLMVVVVQDPKLVEALSAKVSDITRAQIDLRREVYTSLYLPDIVDIPVSDDEAMSRARRFIATAGTTVLGEHV